MQSKAHVNICLHDIVDRSDDVTSIYTITRLQLAQVVHELSSARNAHIINDFTLFFDDGYKSFWDICRSINLGVKNEQVHVAIITELIDTPNKLSSDEIRELSNEGYCIDSHGVSHAALAIFDNETLQPSPKNGAYQNMPYGKKNALSEEEVRFQIIESSKKLKTLTGIAPQYFVLPFGLYNQDVLNVFQREKLYERVYSCDTSCDTQEFLAPRLLITQENIAQLPELLRTLPEKPKLLI